MYRTCASCVLSCGVEGRECETRRNGTDSTDNSQLREEEGKGGYKGVKLKGRQDLDQDLRVEYKRGGGDMQSSVIWVGYSR
jgi:hypothetical protein